MLLDLALFEDQQQDVSGMLPPRYEHIPYSPFKGCCVASGTSNDTLEHPVVFGAP